MVATIPMGWVPLVMVISISITEELYYNYESNNNGSYHSPYHSPNRSRPYRDCTNYEVKRSETYAAICQLHCCVIGSCMTTQGRKSTVFCESRYRKLPHIETFRLERQMFPLFFGTGGAVTNDVCIIDIGRGGREPVKN